LKTQKPKDLKNVGRSIGPKNIQLIFYSNYFEFKTKRRKNNDDFFADFLQEKISVPQKKKLRSAINLYTSLTVLRTKIERSYYTKISNFKSTTYLN
jgi:hypothetical protein